MGTTIDELQVLITANAASFNKQMQVVQRQLDAVGNKATKMPSGFLSAKTKILAVVAAISVALGKVAQSATKEFGNLEQNLGGSKAIFGEYANYLQKKSQEAARTMGMSMNAYMQTANKIGAIMQGSGISQANSLKMTTEWMQRAADQASVMGVSTSEAMMAITGAAKGNFTMMDNIGVKMSATSLEAYALSKGINASFESMSEAQKIALVYGMFLDKTNYSAGNFAREGATTLNGALEVMKANLSNLTAKLGQAFAPVIMQVSNFINNSLIPAIQAAIPYIIAFMRVVGQMVSFVAGALRSLFGGGGKQAESMAQATDTVSDSLGNITAGAGGASRALGGAAKQAKKLKGQLAGFDEMNVLQEPQEASGGGGGSAGGGGASLPDIALPKLAEVDLFNGLVEQADRITSKINEIIGRIDFSPLLNSFSIFGAGLSNVFNGLIAPTFSSLFNNFLLPLSKFTIEDVIPKFLESIGRNLALLDFSSLTNTFAPLLNQLTRSCKNLLAIGIKLFDKFLAPVARIVVQTGINMLGSAFNILASALEAVNNAYQTIKPVLDFLIDMASNIVVTGLDLLSSGISAVADFMSKIIENQVAKTIIEDLAIAVGVIAGAMGVLAVWLGAVAVAQAVWNAALIVFHALPIIAVITGIIVAIVAIVVAIVELIKNFDKIVAVVVGVFNKIKGVIAPVAEWVFNTLLKPIGDFFKTTFDFISKIVETAFVLIVAVATTAIEAVLNVLKPIASFINNVVVQPAVRFFSMIWDGIKTGVGIAWGIIRDVFGAVAGFIGNSVVNPVLGFFNGLWNGITNIFNGIASTIRNIMGGVVNIVKQPINAIIGVINGFISGLNKIKIPDWVPAVGGKGINIPEIPKLARGGLVSGTTIAMIGEAGREAVLPLDKNTGWMDELADKIRGGGPQNLTIKIGEDVIFQKVIDGINEQAFMSNRSVIIP